MTDQPNAFASRIPSGIDAPTGLVRVIAVRQSPMQWLGSALILCGCLVIAYAILFRLGLAPGSQLSLPAPLALQGGAREATLRGAAPGPQLIRPTAVVQRASDAPTRRDAAGPNVSATAVPGSEPPTSQPDAAPGMPLAPSGALADVPFTAAPVVPTTVPIPLGVPLSDESPTPLPDTVASTSVPDVAGPAPADVSPVVADQAVPTDVSIPLDAPVSDASATLVPDSAVPAPPLDAATTSLADAPPAPDPAIPTDAPVTPAQPSIIALSAGAVPGVGTHVSIDSIGLEADVVPGGIIEDRSGNLTWQTLPFVAVHYADNTALVGANGNAVLAGHVVTLYEGNVFRNLYRVNLGDEVRVLADSGAMFVYQVVGVKLVAPSETAVMLPTVEPTLTLLTCGGTFDPRTTEFSDRLIVTAVLTAAVPT